MTPDDLSRLSIPSEVRIAPGGERHAFVVLTPDMDNDENNRQIWVAGKNRSQPFTSGPGDVSPRWSPDGKRLAFLREVEDTGMQAAVMPSDGGEPVVVSEFRHGIEALEWSPDGSTLLAVAVTPTAEWEGLEDDERDRRPRRVTSVPYRFDKLGWTHDRRRHLWLVDPDGETHPRCLTPGDYDEEFPAWSPDGKRIAFISNREPNKGLVSGNHVWEVDVGSGEIAKVAPRGFWVLPSYRPDGVLHLLGNTDHSFPVDTYFYRREPDGTLTSLTAHLDRSSHSLGTDKAAIRWDGDNASVGVEDSGTLGIIRVTPDGTVTRTVEGERIVTDFDTHQGRTIFTASSWDSPGEVFSIDDEGEERLTGLNTTDLGLIEPTHHRVDSEGGEIDVWIYLPPGDGPVPLLLNIHGGPASQYGFGFFDEFQVYAGAGYGVVACNPRGSSGRGIEFNRAVVGEGWGEVDLTDVRTAVSSALELHTRLDESRMGVMGGSYGGFLTAWIIGQEDHWRSAVVERALLSWTSFAGTSDIGGMFPEYYTGVTYPDAWERWWKLSPLSMAHGVTTPTLIIHAEDDFRCPIEQAEQYFMALLRNGTTTEFLRFPDEGHEMSRSGSPKHRVERFEAILDWHGRHLR